MLRPTLISCILTILFFTGCEESPTSVQTSAAVYTTFGESFDDEGTAVTQTPDGGYLVVGSSYNATTLSDMYVIKTNSVGEEVSDSIFTEITGDVVTSFDLISDVKVLADGGYILVGSKFSTATNYDVWLVKLNANLGVEFFKTFDGEASGDDFGYSVSLCDDNGYVISGKTFGSNGFDMWVIKTNALGVLDTTFDTDGKFSYDGTSNGNDAAYSVSQTNDGGYIVTGEARTTGNNADMIVVKLTSLGALNAAFDTDGAATFGGTLDESSKFVQETSDGGFILVGDSFSNGSGQSDIYIVKISAVGAKIWDTYIGGTRNDFANCVKQTTDGGFVIVGNSYSTSSDVLVVKIFPNSQGEVEWQSTFGGDFDDVGNYISQTNDGGYILTGSTYTEDKMNQVLLIKLDASGSQEF
ncbi:MAG: hypothetical protein HOM61_02840 [Candidatus Marinimicrobia bacterium]|jgi:uncharacterized delta-60 repeat protein|nr:hypothetical protein [Candidatus Neomarinimicrobiota bacterium]MBT5956408.1 hypothetical protein [Candidatus Neomarinimicrobiota bacterium]|tara:strand:- start:93 stop:1328 length:1236 start_codon:yes stop_codon:yes gene_type:complete